MATANVLRIHRETFCLLAFPAASTRFRSSALNRTRAMLPFAAPFAGFGRSGRGESEMIGWLEQTEVSADTA